jgi:hypothetical protein
VLAHDRLDTRFFQHPNKQEVGVYSGAMYTQMSIWLSDPADEFVIDSWDPTEHALHKATAGDEYRMLAQPGRKVMIKKGAHSFLFVLQAPTHTDTSGFPQIALAPIDARNQLHDLDIQSLVGSMAARIQAGVVFW